MIPRTFPSTLNPITGQRQLVALFLNNITGLKRWSDYIPVNFGKGTTLVEGRYDNNGFIAIQEITSGIGLVPFKDYVPVFFDPSATDTWQVSDVGFIPYGASGVSIAPSLDLVFTRSDVLDSRITFTRSTTATRTNSSGVIESVAINGARFDYDPVTRAPKGLLIEESRTNLLTYSEQFDNAAWTKTNSTITANTIVSPDGTVDGDKYIPNNATAFSASVVRTGNITKAASATTYTATVYAKVAEYNRILLQVRDGATSANNAVVIFSLVDGIIVSAASASGTFTAASAAAATFVGNGWFRCNLTFTSGTETNLNLQVSARDSIATTGDGTSGIFLWGAQLEAGAFATSYIPTVASQVTRAADAASMTGTNFSSWYNDAEGTLYADFLPNAVAPSTVAQVILMASDASAANTGEIYKRANADVSTRFSVNSNSVSSAFINLGVFTQSNTKSAGAYKVNDFAGVRAAGTAVVDTTGNTAFVSQLNIGSYFNNTSFLNGTISKLAYYPKRLTNTELQGLTS